jgi:hypothetical protein
MQSAIRTESAGNYPKRGGKIETCMSTNKLYNDGERMDQDISVHSFRSAARKA